MTIVKLMLAPDPAGLGPVHQDKLTGYIEACLAAGIRRARTPRLPEGVVGELTKREQAWNEFWQSLGRDSGSRTTKRVGGATGLPLRPPAS